MKGGDILKIVIIKKENGRKIASFQNKKKKKKSSDVFLTLKGVTNSQKKLFNKFNNNYIKKKKLLKIYNYKIIIERMDSYRI